MKKGVKKKNRKLRRQIRKTIGALFMASAITVAAIPVQDVSADPGVTNEKIKVAVYVGDAKQGVHQADVKYGFESVVPYVIDAKGDINNQVIYSSGDGLFKFAYIRSVGAVILDYDDPNNGNSVVIPEKLEAYRNYSENYQGKEYYCLVNAKDELMLYKLRDQPLVDPDGRAYYRTTNRMPDGTNLENIEKIVDVLSDDKGYFIYYDQTVQKRDENGNLVYDDDGKPVMITQQARADVEPMLGERYYPCYYNQREVWSKIPKQQLYSHPKNPDGTDNYDESAITVVGGDVNRWGIEATVKYIGAEKIVAQGSSWKLVQNDERDTPNEGVFANEISLATITIEAPLDGVSDYAFYNCPQLSRVEFKSGLQTLGNGAFAECMQLREVVLPTAQAIGKDAFYNCTSLTNLKLPSKTLQYLGDCAFEGCTQLTKVDFLLYNDNGSQDLTGSVPLRYIGNHLFRGCMALSEMQFPNGYVEKDPLDIDMFEGCTSLQKVILPDTTSGANIKFVSDHTGDNADYHPNCTGNTWESFRKTVPDSFYFEGPVQSDIHTTANDNSVTYKYPGEELYERVVAEHDAVKDAANPDGTSARVFYKVRVENGNVGRLVEFGILNYAGENNKSHPDIISIPEKIGTYGISSLEGGSFNNNCDLIKVTIPASVKAVIS